jgi:hypothetical protein
MGQVHTAFRSGDYCTSEFDVIPALGSALIVAPFARFIHTGP